MSSICFRRKYRYTAILKKHWAYCFTNSINEISKEIILDLTTSLEDSKLAIILHKKYNISHGCNCYILLAFFVL